jgi:hypothetical protein
VDAKEPVYNAHKVDLAALTKNLEQSFDCRIFGKVDTIINIETKRERRI